MGIADRVDGAQRRFPVLGLPIAVVYKFFDDQGNYLAATITYYAFVAIFPLLLLGTSILGFVLQGNPELQQHALESALTQVPVVGDQVGSPEGLQGSSLAVVVGAVAALYGALGLGQAIQNALHVAWSVPRNSRPNPFLLRLRSLLLLVIAGTALIGLTVVSLLGRYSQLFGHDVGTAVKWLIVLADVALIGLILTVLLWFGGSRSRGWRNAVPGGLFISLMWQVLQLLSAAYVKRVANEASSMNQTFGVVLGLVGLIFLAAVISVLGMELNVVLGRHLWPRALLTPFTDSVDLTTADRRAYTGYARAQRHKGFEEVTVTFTDPPHHGEDPVGSGDEPPLEGDPAAKST